MAVVNKTYLDFPGLQTYDSNIKQVIADVETQVPAISVNTATKTLVIDLPNLSSTSSSSNTTGD